MKITVRYFAQLRDRFGKDAETVELGGLSRVGDLLEVLFPRADEREKMQKYLRAAVNREYASCEQKLNDGDEVVFIPPVAGG